MENKEQLYATKKFNILKSAEDFKQKVGSNFDIKEYKDGKFGIRFKIDKNRPKKKYVFKKQIITTENPSDFESEINECGTNWHTSESF